MIGMPEIPQKKVVAKILPLDGKYYGTKVHVDYGIEGIDIVIWKSTGKLSKRQCEYWSIPEGHETDAEIRLDYLCDNHYESALSFMVADLLCKRLNNLTEEEVREFVAGANL